MRRRTACSSSRPTRTARSPSPRSPWKRRRARWRWTGRSRSSRWATAPARKSTTWSRRGSSYAPAQPSTSRARARPATSRRTATSSAAAWDSGSSGTARACSWSTPSRNWGQTPIFSLELHDVQVQLALADVLRRVGRARVDLPNLACLPYHLFLLAVGVDALERAALQGAHDADGGRRDALVLGSGRVGHLVGLRLVVIDQHFHLDRGPLVLGGGRIHGDPRGQERRGQAEQRSS